MVHMLAFMFYLPFVMSLHKSCSWNDGKGHVYDLSSLQKSTNYELVDEKNSLGMFTMVYEYNFCSQNVECNGKQAAAVEALQVMGAVTDNCDILGIASTQEIAYLDPLNPDLGIGITYSEGDMCFELQDENVKGLQGPQQASDDNMKMVTRAVTFQLKCGSESGQFELVDNASCHVIFIKTSPLGCRNYSGSGGYYNSKQSNQTILESIPHKEFWHQFPFLVKDGIAFTMQFTISKIRQLQGKNPGGSGGYQTV